MAAVLGWLVTLVVVGGLIAIPVLVMARLRRNLTDLQQAPPDLRRADDGDDDNPAGGPGLGPYWPVN
jgi:hypothetical protein